MRRDEIEQDMERTGQHAKGRGMIRYRNVALVLTIAMLLLVGMYLAGVQGGLTGYLTGMPGAQETEYTDTVSLTITSHTDYTLELEEHMGSVELLSVKLDGEVLGEGGVRAYLVAADTEYDILLQESGSDEEDEQTSSEAVIIAEAVADNTTDKTIEIGLAYQKDTRWDADNDGTAYTKADAVDLSVADTSFSWNVDESKLCTRWSITSKETGESTASCNGAADCCSLSGIAPTEESWDEPLYIYYEQYGTTLDNSVTAQVMFLDQSLDEGDVHFESTQSGIAALDARFEEAPEREFSEECIETCSLPESLDDASYTIVFEVEEGTLLKISRITYVLKGAEPEQIETTGAIEAIPDIKDAKGRVLAANIEFKDPNTGKALGHDKLTKGRYNVDVDLSDEDIPVKSIEINDLDLEDALTDFINVDDVAETGELSQFVEVYAIDPTAVNFTDATVTVTATGTALYKCKDWNFAAQRCDGSWELFKTGLVPGEDYTFTLTPDDPGFAEMAIQNCVGDAAAASRDTWGTACTYSYPGTALSYADGTTENFAIGKNDYTGIKITSSNSSVTDCTGITSVHICYKWWYTSSKSIGACSFDIDADGGASPSAHSTTCPSGSEPSGITCDDITSMVGETWTCGTFFTASPTGAIAKEDFKGGDPGTFYTDALYFNVTYDVADSTPPATVTGLANQSAGQTWIYWTWTNPGDGDFNHTEVWINDTWYANVSAPTSAYNATGLTDNTTYEIQTRTADHDNNVNTTWVNDLGMTQEAPAFVPTVGFSVTLPGEGPVNASAGGNATAAMDFNASLNTYYGLEPCVQGSGECQNSTVPFFVYANTGNLNLTINVRLDSALPAAFNLRVNTLYDNGSATDVTTSPLTLGSDIAPGNNLDAFFFGDFMNAYPNDSTTRDLYSNGTQT